MKGPSLRVTLRFPLDEKVKSWHLADQLANALSDQKVCQVTFMAEQQVEQEMHIHLYGRTDKTPHHTTMISKEFMAKLGNTDINGFSVRYR